MAKAKVVEVKLTFADYEALPKTELFKLAKEMAVKPTEALNTAKDKIVGALKIAAKIVAAMKRLYVDRLNKREIPADTKFTKYFKDNVTGELPGRVEAIASLFNSLCLTLNADGKPMLSEDIFDDAAPDWLEKASAIVNAAQKAHGEEWKTCDDVLDMINALSKPGDAAKKLKEIREGQKGVSAGTEAGDEKPASEIVPLTVGRALEYLLAAIAAAQADEQGEALFRDCQCLHTAWDRMDKKTLAKWERNLARGVAPGVEIKTPANGEPVAV